MMNNTKKLCSVLFSFMTVLALQPVKAHAQQASTLAANESASFCVARTLVAPI